MGVNNMGKRSQMWLQISAYRQNLDFWFSDGPSMATGAKYGFQFRKRKWIIPFMGLAMQDPCMNVRLFIPKSCSFGV